MVPALARGITGALPPSAGCRPLLPRRTDAPLYVLSSRGAYPRLESLVRD